MDRDILSYGSRRDYNAEWKMIFYKRYNSGILWHEKWEIQRPFVRVLKEKQKEVGGWASLIASRPWLRFSPKARKSLAKPGHFSFPFGEGRTQLKMSSYFTNSSNTLQMVLILIMINGIKGKKNHFSCSFEYNQYIHVRYDNGKSARSLTITTTTTNNSPS